MSWPDVGDTNYGIGLISAKFYKADEQEPNDPEDPEEPEEPDVIGEITGGTTIAFTGSKDTDTKKMYAYSKEGIDFSQTVQVGEENIPVLMLDESFVEGKTELPEISVVYAVKANSPFKLEALMPQEALDINLTFKIMVSEDGESWSNVENVLSKTESLEGTSWLKQVLGIASLGDVNYVKIVWPNQKDYTGTINPVSGNALDSLNYAPALSKVVFNGTTTETTENNPDTGVETPITAALILTIACAFTALSKRRKDY